MAYLEVTGSKLWYEDTGGPGDPVVFLHPFTANTEGWLHQLPVFTGAGYRCVVYDRRGWGRSQTTSRIERTPCASADLHDLVEHLGLERFHLVGTGGGGYVALDYAVTYPGDLYSLVAACTGGPLQQDSEYMAIGSKYGRVPDFQSLPAWFRELGPTYRVANPEGVDRWIEIERSSLHGASPEEIMANRFTLRTLETIQVPTLMLAADADLYAAPPRMRAMASRIPGCRFALVPEAGHAAYWEQPEIWNKLVLDFIGTFRPDVDHQEGGKP